MVEKYLGVLGPQSDPLCAVLRFFDNSAPSSEPICKPSASMLMPCDSAAQAGPFLYRTHFRYGAPFGHQSPKMCYFGPFGENKLSPVVRPLYGVVYIRRRLVRRCSILS